MPAPSRLRSIDPDALAREVGRVLVQHRAALAPRPRDVEAGDPSAFPAAGAIGDLARYVERADASSPPEVIEAAARTVVADLYSAPADLLPGAPPLDGDAWAERIEGNHDVAVVLRAALARARLASGRDVPAAWLADLAGVPLEGIAAALTSGELAATRVPRGREREALVAADYASAWLVARGVIAPRVPEKKGRRVDPTR